jgi:hypothetical protein
MTGMTGFWSAAGIFSTTPATAVTASKAIRLRRFKNELIILMIFRGKSASMLRICCVEKVKRNFSFVKQIFPAEAIGHSARASLRPLKHPCRPPAREGRSGWLRIKHNGWHKSAEDEWSSIVPKDPISPNPGLAVQGFRRQTLYQSTKTD